MAYFVIFDDLNDLTNDIVIFMKTNVSFMLYIVIFF